MTSGSLESRWSPRSLGSASAFGLQAVEELLQLLQFIRVAQINRRPAVAHHIACGIIGYLPQRLQITAVFRNCS